MADALSPITRAAVLLAEACRRWRLIGATGPIRDHGIEELFRQAHRLQRPGMPARPAETASQAERLQWVDHLMLWAIDQAHGIRCELGAILAAVRPVADILESAATIEESGLTWLGGNVDQWHVAQRARTTVRIARLCAYRTVAHGPTEHNRAVLSVAEKLARTLDGILAITDAENQLTGWRSGPDVGTDMALLVRELEALPARVDAPARVPATQAPPAEASTAPAAEAESPKGNRPTIRDDDSRIAKAIVLLHQGKSVSKIANEIGIHRATLYRVATFREAMARRDELAESRKRASPRGTKQKRHCAEPDDFEAYSRDSDDD